MRSPPASATPPGLNARGGRPAAGPLAELEAGFQRAPRLARGPGCTPAAQRRLPGPRLRRWSEGGAAGTGCPMEMGLGDAGERESLRRALPAWGADSSLPVVNVVGGRGARPAAAAPGCPPLLPGLAGSANGRTAPPCSSPSPGRPAQTLNFSGLQSVRRLLLPAVPALPPDARSPAVSVQPGIGTLSRSQLGRA